MSIPYDEATLQLLLARLTELETQVARLPELEQEVSALRVPQAKAATEAPPRATRASRRGLFKAGLSAAVGAVGAGALLETRAGTATASNGQSVVLGQQNLAETATEVHFDGTGSPGVILLGNDTSFSPTAAAYPAATAGWASGIAVQHGVYGYTEASGGYGVVGVSAPLGSGAGVFGSSNTGTGVSGSGPTGVSGTGTGPTGTGVSGSGYYGVIGNGTFGVQGESTTGTGVTGIGPSGVTGTSTSTTGTGVTGTGNATSGTGVTGTGGSVGVSGRSTHGYGVAGSGSVGVHGNSTASTGVAGYGGPTGVYGSGSAYGVYGSGATGVYGTGSSYAGYFNGNGYFNGSLQVNGILSKTAGSFKIDHPLAPADKYLYHSFVESPDMMNVYNGLATLDAHGTAEVALPAWFDALNRDLRYQLTPIGGPAPHLHVATKVQGNRFAIAGGPAGLEVSWQVTGIRQDAWAEAHRIPVEEDKPAEERGFYLHPEVFGAPAERSIATLHQPPSPSADRLAPARDHTALRG